MSWRCTNLGCSYSHADKQRVLDHVERVHGAAGRVSLTRSRTTGTMVGIYEGAASGISDAPYVVVCEDHGSLVEVETLRNARNWAPVPDQWCEDCR